MSFLTVDERYLQRVPGGFMAFIPDVVDEEEYDDDEEVQGYIFQTYFDTLGETTQDTLSEDDIYALTNLTFMLSEVLFSHESDFDDLDETQELADRARVSAFTTLYHWNVDTSERSTENAFDMFSYTLEDCEWIAKALQSINVVDESKEQMYPYTSGAFDIGDISDNEFFKLKEYNQTMGSDSTNTMVTQPNATTSFVSVNPNATATATTGMFFGNYLNTTNSGIALGSAETPTFVETDTGDVADYYTDEYGTFSQETWRGL